MTKNILIANQEIVEKIGSPGGPYFLKLLEVPEPVYHAYWLKVRGDRSLVNSAQLQLIHAQWVYWITSLHWVYKKKFDSKHKMPFCRKASKILEPIGEILYRALILIEQLHLYDNQGIKAKHTNHWGFFAHCSIELFSLCLGDWTDGKTGKIKQLRATTKALRAEINPFPENSALHELIDCSFRLYSDHPTSGLIDSLLFSKNGLIAAIATYASFLNTSGDIVSMRADKTHLVFHAGRGKGVLKIDPKTI